MKQTQFPVIDLFAGPGGLGEGFSSFRSTKQRKGPNFSIVASVEMEEKAHQTLKLRSFYRELLAKNLSTANFFDWLNRGAGMYQPSTKQEQKAWGAAHKHAIRHELGKNKVEDEQLENKILARLNRGNYKQSRVLIGGPPCQAYSNAGRSRNKGIKNYDPKKDHRHFLYLEYLKMVLKTEPAVFVMENVAGILTAKVDDNRIFPRILKDLSDPAAVMGQETGPKYRIHSLVSDVMFKPGDDPDDIEGKLFRIHPEDYGIPQKRHRVILLGVREDINKKPENLKASTERFSVLDAISDLPPLRSGLSKKGPDSNERWLKWIGKAKSRVLKVISHDDSMKDLTTLIDKLEFHKTSSFGVGGKRVRKQSGKGRMMNSLVAKCEDKSLKVVLNHEARGHMYTDLQRYLFSSAYASKRAVSPKAKEYPRPLAPRHKNWKSGKFNDRFRTQVGGLPATTVTSHISKDGNYFIHPEPEQCRSLTVREAARLQTFPDNYFFMGERTAQYVQVGNAVPPLLAKQIAEVVFNLIRDEG